MSAIPPGGGSPLRPPATATGPGGKGARGESPVAQATSAEREAQKRINDAYLTTQTAERESRKRLDDVRDEYVRRVESESARNEEVVESEREKGYRAIRDIQRAQNAEINRIRREGDTQLEDLRNHYRNAIYSTESRGKEELQQLQGQSISATESEKRNQALMQEQARAEAAFQTEQQREGQALARESLIQEGHSEYEKLKLTTAEATEQARSHFEERHDAEVEHLQSALGRLQQTTVQKLEDIRSETALKLSAFDEQKSDPFYRLVDIGSRMDETSDAFIVVAKIPVHEREHLSVSLKGENLVISGSRRNEEKIEIDPKHTISTASYQSYNESFPLDWPVDGKKLTKRYDGDYLIVEVPKRKYAGRASPYQAPQPDRIRAERPRFPSNIPYSSPATAHERPLAPESGPKKTRNGGTTLG